MQEEFTPTDNIPTSSLAAPATTLPYGMYHIHWCSLLFCVEGSSETIPTKLSIKSLNTKFSRWLNKQHQQRHTVLLTPICEYAIKCLLLFFSSPQKLWFCPLVLSLSLAAIQSVYKEKI
jgi:hypothetical protein